MAVLNVGARGRGRHLQVDADRAPSRMVTLPDRGARQAQVGRAGCATCTLLVILAALAVKLAGQAVPVKLPVKVLGPALPIVMVKLVVVPAAMLRWLRSWRCWRPLGW